MAIENLPLFTAMNREEVKPLFPCPPRPMTSQESHFAIMEKVNACIAEVNHFEQRVKFEIDKFMRETETENRVFKEAIQASYNAFQQLIQNEVNNFETTVQNNFDLFTSNVDYMNAQFQTAINKEMGDFQTRIDKLVNEYIKEVDATVANAKTYMETNLDTTIRTIFDEKVANGSMSTILSGQFGESRVFKGTINTTELNALTDMNVGDYWYNSDNGNYYQYCSNGWVSIGTGVSVATSLFSLREGANYDADACTESGFIFISSSNEWSNIPDNYKAGVLITFNQDVKTRFYQMFIGYGNGAIYYRTMTNGVFNVWKRVVDTDFFNTKFDELSVLTFKEFPDLNFDNVTETGIYYTSSSSTYENIPAESGMLLVYNSGKEVHHCYQTFISYRYNKVYYRNKKVGADTGFTDWVSNEGFAYNGTVANETDLNTLLTQGYYSFGSGETVYNAPDDVIAGMLMVYVDPVYMNTRLYQVLYSYNQKAYFRVINNATGSFGNWKRLLTVEDIEGFKDAIDAIENGNNYEYYIAKNDNEDIYIYKRGVNGFIRYQYYRHVNTNINLDTWQIGSIYLCDNAMTPLKEISSAGADNEGVLRIDGEADYVGGIHGDEQFTDFCVFIDGVEYMFETIKNMWCNEIRFIVNSNITHADTTNVCMTKNKQTTFDKDGIHVNNRWKTLEEIKFAHVRAILLSVDKSCVSKYYDSNVNTYPVEIPESGGTWTDNNIVDIYFMGEISAHNWAGVRGGDASMYNTLINDYGYRMKSYFDCYTGYTAQAGEELYCQNNFHITC